MIDADFNAEHQLSHKAEDQAREENPGLWERMENMEAPDDDEESMWYFDETAMAFRMRSAT